MDEQQQTLVGQTLQVLPRALYAEDGDKGIRAPIEYSFEQQKGANDASSDSDRDEPSATKIDTFLHLNPATGELRLIRQWPSQWTGAPLTLVVRATQLDNKDRYALTTLTIVSRAPSSASAGSLASGSSVSLAPPVAPPNASGALEFAPDHLSVSVREDVHANEKIARVRARYLGADSSSAAASSSSSSSVELIGEQPRRATPINYQLLDADAELFGINGVGEIFVKRALDFELKQEHKFRVLATYSKHSDICLVHVRVINVNDNKPKVSVALSSCSDFVRTRD